MNNGHKRGPKAKPKAMRRRLALKVYFRASEREELSAAAIAHGRDVSAWARDHLLALARADK